MFCQKRRKMMQGHSWSYLSWKQIWAARTLEKLWPSGRRSFLRLNEQMTGLKRSSKAKRWDRIFFSAFVYHISVLYFCYCLYNLSIFTASLLPNYIPVCLFNVLSVAKVILSPLCCKQTLHSLSVCFFSISCWMRCVAPWSIKTKLRVRRSGTQRTVFGPGSQIWRKTFLLMIHSFFSRCVCMFVLVGAGYLSESFFICIPNWFIAPKLLF